MLYACLLSSEVKQNERRRKKRTNEWEKMKSEEIKRKTWNTPNGTQLIEAYGEDIFRVATIAEPHTHTHKSIPKALKCFPTFPFPFRITTHTHMYNKAVTFCPHSPNEKKYHKMKWRRKMCSGIRAHKQTILTIWPISMQINSVGRNRSKMIIFILPWPLSFAFRWHSLNIRNRFSSISP